jgi:hypothetical protein
LVATPVSTGVYFFINLLAENKKPPRQPVASATISPRSKFLLGINVSWINSIPTPYNKAINVIQKNITGSLELGYFLFEKAQHQIKTIIRKMPI